MIKRVWISAVFVLAIGLFLCGCGGGGSSAPAPASGLSVTSTFPGNGAMQVAFDAQIVANFNSALDAASVTPFSFQVTGPGNAPVVGTVTVAGATATFTPTSPLSPSTTYVARITPAVRNQGGAALPQDATWSFTTSSRTVQVGGVANDTLAAVAADVGGNVLVAGYTAGALGSFASAGGDDVFLAKYDVDGVRKWLVQKGSSGRDRALGAAVDGAGNFFVVGETTGLMASAGANAGGSDLFLLKYDANGTLTGSSQLGSPQTDVANGVAVDAVGNVYVGGFTAGNLDGNINAGANDAFITRYDAQGNRVWTRQFGTTADDSVLAVAVDAAGNVYAAGETRGSLSGANSGLADGFVRSYDPQGNVRWTRQLGSAVSDTASGVTVTATGEVTVCGYTAGAFAGATNAGGTDIFVARLAVADGADLLAPAQFGGAGNDFANAVSANAATGEFFVGGFTDGTLPTASSAGGGDLFLIGYALDGTRNWIRQFGTAATDRAFSVAFGAFSSRVFIAGETLGGLDGNVNPAGGASSDGLLTVHSPGTGNRL